MTDRRLDSTADECLGDLTRATSRLSSREPTPAARDCYAAEAAGYEAAVVCVHCDDPVGEQQNSRASIGKEGIAVRWAARRNRDGWPIRLCSRLIQPMGCHV